MPAFVHSWSLAALLALAGSATAAPIGPAPVIEGTQVRHDPAVVALALVGGTIYCSGTLVSPRVIVTAAHCVHKVAPPGRVFFGTDPAVDGVFMPVETAVAHPDYAKNGRVDIGLVILARPATVRPIALPDRDLANPALSGMIRLVGFGDTEPTNPGQVTGVKFGRDVPLQRIDGYFLRYGVGACVGDSGGPTLARDSDGTERLVGVISRGDAACASYGDSTRVDLYRDWIESWITAADAPSCELDMRCAADCETPDPDCIDIPAVPPVQVDDSGGCSVSGDANLPLVLIVLGLVLSRRRS